MIYSPAARHMVHVYSKVFVLLDVLYLFSYTVFCILRAIFYTYYPPKPKSLQREVIVIFGAGRGVGEAIALVTSYLGAIVVCVDINSIANENVVLEILKRGGQGFAYTCDVTSNEQVQRTVDVIERRVGEIAMYFHCCSVPSPRTYTTPAPPIQDTINLSLMSHFWILKAILPRMKARGYGHIVLLTSVTGATGITAQDPLTVCQFAVRGVFEAILKELRTSEFDKIKMSLAHVYPLVVKPEHLLVRDFRIPSYFGTILADKAANAIVSGVLRNQIEIGLPSKWLLINHLIRLMPRQAADAVRDFLNTGVDIG